MSDIIHLLPDSVANQIAAGEVIQRPASCLKELVENSLDAGATHIRIIVRDAGRTLLQVVDDGKGMSPTDARMAFERHATSKISQASDLFALRTMGFRGEALASICAVAHVELQTRRQEDEVGTRVEIAGSKVIGQEVVQCAVGTNIRVKNLFYNVPARKKFLKTAMTEGGYINELMERMALSRPDISFKYMNNGKTMLHTTGGNELKDIIYHIYGRDIAMSVLPVKYPKDDFGIEIISNVFGVIYFLQSSYIFETTSSCGLISQSQPFEVSYFKCIFLIIMDMKIIRKIFVKEK